MSLALSCDNKERRHNNKRSAELAFNNYRRDPPIIRHRDSPHHGTPRWVSDDLRRPPPPRNGKQGRWAEDDFCRPRSEGRFRNNRENRVSFSQRDFSQRDCKGSSWENCASPNYAVRSVEVNNHRSVDDNMLTYNSHPHSDSWDQVQFKDQDDKIGSGAGGTDTVQRFDRDYNTTGSLDWKPLKWTRSGSLSSRCSTFSHSSSSKSIGVDSTETKTDAQPRSLTPVQSPSGDAAACMTFAGPIEERNSRKKPRLGWGEGLAKYEKKRVEGPDEVASKNEQANLEPLHCDIPQLAAEKCSPGIVGYSECVSPLTPSSVACNSSPGLEDKSFSKATNVDAGTSKLSISPRPVELEEKPYAQATNFDTGTSDSKLSISPPPVPQNLSEEVVLPFNLENLDASPVFNLSSSLDELLKPDDRSLLDSLFVRSTAVNKLILWKANISKALEMTESEIDLLENELKTLSPCPCPTTSSLLPAYAASNLISRPAPLEFLSSGDMINEKTLAQVRENPEGKDEDIDGPGIATSKFPESHSSGKLGDCSSGIVDSRTENLDEKCCIDHVNGVKGVVASNSYSTLSTDIRLNLDRDDMLSDIIFTANKESAHRASDELFSKFSPSGGYMSMVAKGVVLRSDPLLKERFARKKHFSRFKERIITLKFRAFQHIWKEDLRLLSIRRHVKSSQKRLELGTLNVPCSNRKHRSSIRSRFSTPAGNLSLVPTTEVINFTSKLLSDSQVQIYRSTLKMPSLIAVKERFISKNGLVEDPYIIEKERCMINPWTLEEKGIFMDKFVTYGKDFRKIASFLDHKTTADCVEFYYKNHKSDAFPKIKKKPDFANPGKTYSSSTYLVTSGKKWNREADAAASLNMLGAASAIASDAEDDTEHQQHTSKFFFSPSTDYRTPRVEEERSMSPEIFGNERETVAADVLAGICGSFSSEAMSSCITSSVGASTVRRPLTPGVTQNIGEETCSDESCGEMDPSDWTDEEKSIFIQAVSSYGKDFRMISRCVRTRTSDQCKVFFSKARKCLGLDRVGPVHCDEGTRISDDADRSGGSDTEDACVVEMGSATFCTEKSEFMMEVANNNESERAGTIELYCNVNQSEETIGVGEMDSKNSEMKSEILVSDDCDAENKLELDCDGDDRVTLAMGIGESSVMKTGESEASGHESSEETISTDYGNDQDCLTASADETGNTAQGPVSDECCKTEMVGCDLALPGSSDGGVENIDANTSTVSGTFARDLNSIPQAAGNASVLSEPFHPSSSALDFANLSPIRREKSEDLSSGGTCLLDCVEPSQILREYPVTVSSNKGKNGVINGKKPSLLQSMSKLDSKSPRDGYLLQDYHLQKCSNDPKCNDSHSELQFLSHGDRKDNTRPQDEVKPCRNGNNVKLFGQILTHPASSHVEPKPCKTENDKKGPEQNGTSFNLKFTNIKTHDGNLPVAKVERHSYLAYDNRAPVRSYGFWDGNRIQTGYSSFPDSAMLLAKYPAAFGNCQMSSSQIDPPQAMHPVVKSNEQRLNDISVFPTREMSSSNGVADYQVYRSSSGDSSTTVPPFKVDIKQRRDILISELQRRNEADMQQQTRGGMVGIVGNGGIIGVSDPVAAIKLHYAKTEKYNVQNGGTGGINREQQESWRGNGDIGR